MTDPTTMPLARSAFAGPLPSVKLFGFRKVGPHKIIGGLLISIYGFYQKISSFLKLRASRFHRFERRFKFIFLIRTIPVW